MVPMHRRRFTYANVAATLAVVIALGFTPATAHIGDGINHLWGDHIKPKLSTLGNVNSPSNPVSWTKLKSVPAGLADGVDSEGTDLRTSILSNGDPYAPGPGFISSERLSAGVYRLEFDTEVETCQLLVTSSDANTPGFVNAAVEGRFSQEEPDYLFMVRVLTFNSSGVPEDRESNFAAFCP